LAALLWVLAVCPARAGTAKAYYVTNRCYGACPATQPPPGPLRPGEPYTVTVAAVDDGNLNDEGFNGTVEFSSSDPEASLPARYRFTPSDRGIHRFEFVVRKLGPHTLTAFDPAGILRAGQLTQEAVLTTNRPMLTQTGFRVPGGFVRGLANGPDGNVWYSAGGGPSGMGPTTPNGFGHLTPEGVATELDPKAPFTGGIVTGLDGNLWYASAGDGMRAPGRIGRMTPEGVVTLFDVPLPQSAPQDVALGADGNVWFADAVGAIGRITPSGAMTLFPTPTANSVPFHITQGPDGALWFTEYGTKAIGRIDMTGAIREYPTRADGGAPWAIATGPDGRLWYTTNSDRIGSVGVSGDVVEYANPTGAASYGIGRGPDGAVWFGSLGSLVRIVPGPATAAPTLQVFATLWGASAESVITGPDSTLWYGDQGRVSRIKLQTCGDKALCIEGRFLASLSFQNGGRAAFATPLLQTANTGYFSFFTANNIDVALKIVDGRAFNGRYWVFVASLTNLEFSLEVTDLVTGVGQRYNNASGQQTTIADTNAFPPDRAIYERRSATLH